MSVRDAGPVSSDLLDLGLSRSPEVWQVADPITKVVGRLEAVERATCGPRRRRGGRRGLRHSFTLPGRLRSPDATSNTSTTHRSGE